MAKYLQIFMIWTTLSVSMLIVPGSTGSASQITTLSYDCKSDGSMVIKVPDDYSLQNIDSFPCTNSTTGQGSGQFVLKNCMNKNQTIAVKHNALLGGQLPIFSLLCEDSKYTIQLSATALPINPNPSPTPMSTQPISYNSKIKMMIKDKQGHQANSAVIGETLSLVISAPEHFQVDPLSCNAVSGHNTYPIWSTSRLVDYDSVTISCTVDVCPNGVGGCIQKCVTGTNSGNPNKRRRRNAAIGNSQKVNRHLETNLRVYDSVEDKIQASGASVLTTSYVAVFCVLVSALYHRQL